MLKKTIFLSIIITYILVLISCAASTGSRYDKESTQTNSSQNPKETTAVNETLKEDFDFTPYKTKIVIPEKKLTDTNANDEIWFTYGDNENQIKKKSVVGSADGYRVLVLITDNLDEANQIRSEIYFNNKSEEVYVDFEPPFYKVKIGDFDSERNANELRFKLNQQGYQEAKVIKDKINKFE